MLSHMSLNISLYSSSPWPWYKSSSILSNTSVSTLLKLPLANCSHLRQCSVNHRLAAELDSYLIMSNTTGRVARLSACCLSRVNFRNEPMRSGMKLPFCSLSLCHIEIMWVPTISRTSPNLVWDSNSWNIMIDKSLTVVDRVFYDSLWTAPVVN